MEEHKSSFLILGILAIVAITSLIVLISGNKTPGVCGNVFECNEGD